MKINPIAGIAKGIKVSLAFLGIGGLYLYNHPSLSKGVEITGPFRTWPEIKPELDSSMEVQFKFKSPIGVRPGIRK